MSSIARVIIATTALVILGACSSESAKSTHRHGDTTAALNIKPGDTCVLGGDQTNPFVLTMHNEGAASVVVTCVMADYESAVTLGPGGESTRTLSAKGYATLTNTSEQDGTQVAITMTSDCEQSISIDYNHRELN